MLHKQFDFLIIGSGLAGLYAAYEAAKHGSVAIITKSELDVSNSYYAQGGIAAVTDSNDSPQLHLKDTIVSGRGLCDYTPVHTLVNEGPHRIKDLMKMGMEFDKENGELSLALEGGHRRRRVLHAGGDSTGKKLVQFLIKKVLESSTIEAFENQMVYELLVKNKRCFGARSFNIANNSNLSIQAKSTILTLGGASAVYQRSTNPATTVGDGIALAYQAGAEISDMEFIQFHPSSFCTKEESTFLISEAVRGEGAYLLNSKGERFMTTIHELAELAPRDIVARSIFNEMRKYGDNHVNLSLKHLDGSKLKKRFPSIYAKCKESGVDFLNKIPIAPAAHYTVGGVKTDVNAQTNIANLYACGELASTGVMGANRLASNSLLECLVFGKRAIQHSINSKKNFKSLNSNFKGIVIDHSLSDSFLKITNDVAKAMNKKVGIIRSAQQLQEILNLIDNINTSFPFKDKEYFSIRMQNLLCVCKLTTTAALARKESRGGHYREDFNTENKDFLAHSVQELNKELTFIPIEVKSE